MDAKFIEAGQGAGERAGNWGKFMVCRYTEQEMAVRPRFPGCESRPPLTDLRGRGVGQFWVLDLQTGEGVRFPTLTEAPAALAAARAWVCPMYGPLVEWLFGHIEQAPTTWWDDLPPYVLLPDAPFSIFGRPAGTTI